MYDPMYHPQHHEPPQPPQGNGYAHAPPPPNAVEEAAHTPSASNLDHALLESLFYNEMVTFEPSAGQVALPTEHDTPHTIVEKEILRDFGVGGTTLFAPHAEPSLNEPQYNGHATAAAPQHPATSNPPVSGYATGVLPQPVAPMQQQQQQQQQSLHHQQHQHPVSNPPLHHQAAAAPIPPPQYATPVSTPTYALPVGNASAPPPTTSTPVVSNGTTLLAAPGQPQPQQPQQPQQQQHPTQMVYMDTEATATAAAAAAAMLSGGGTSNNSSSGGGGMKVPGMASPNTTLKTASMTTAYATNPASTAAPNNGILPTQQPPPQHAPQHAQPHAQQAVPVQVPEQKARQLVDQFATLASRLGIDLPDSVLKSLTSAAAKNDPSLLKGAAPVAAAAAATTPTPTVATSATPTTTPSATTPTTTTIPTRTVASNSVAKSSKGTVPPPKGGSAGTTTELTAMAPTVMELRNMAEEAIAAVTRSGLKRTASTEMLSKTASSQARPATSGNEHKPTYSKRRKKPRLSDCEARLAQLKAENEQLKRHLQNVSNKAHKFDKEKEEAGKQIARLMHDPNAGPREMEQSVRKFSDMYSDYGINRQQELSFHLEQLQRLVNPTNFTKMGLWTLGQSNQGTIKKNPIAGILVKELDITPQQGRKILDQSEKIRKLCDNLKEAHALLVKLKYLCEKKTRCFQDRMNKCTEILTSKQVVKLICWINENTALLENVCPGWGTEHIQPKK